MWHSNEIEPARMKSLTVIFVCFLGIVSCQVNLIPSPFIAIVGGGATFQCTSLTEEILDVEWLLNGSSLENFDPTNVRRVSFQSSEILEFTKLTIDFNATNITCRASLGSGKTVESNSMLFLEVTSSATVPPSATRYSFTSVLHFIKPTTITQYFTTKYPTTRYFAAVTSISTAGVKPTNKGKNSQVVAGSTSAAGIFVGACLFIVVLLVVKVRCFKSKSQSAKQVLPVSSHSLQSSKQDKATNGFQEAEICLDTNIKDDATKPTISPHLSVAHIPTVRDTLPLDTVIKEAATEPPISPHPRVLSGHESLSVKHESCEEESSSAGIIIPLPNLNIPSQDRTPDTPSSTQKLLSDTGEKKLKSNLKPKRIISAPSKENPSGIFRSKVSSSQGKAFSDITNVMKTKN